MATAFSDLDNARENANLSAFYNGLGAIKDPEKFREDNLNREAFNNLVTLGTATFGAPLAAHGLEGLKSDIGIRYRALQQGADKRATGRTLQDIVNRGRARAAGEVAPPGEVVGDAPPVEDVAGAARAALDADGATDIAREGEGALANLRGQLQRRALIRGNMRWATEVNLRQQGDALHRGFLEPDDPRYGRFDPEGRVEALADVPEEEAAAAGRPTAAEARAVFARVRGRYLARAAARQAAAADPDGAAAPAEAAATAEEQTAGLERMAQGVSDQAAASVTADSARPAADFAQRAALKAERIRRIIRGEPTDDLPADDTSVPGRLPSDPDYDEREEQFAQGVQDAKNGDYEPPDDVYEEGGGGADYEEGHAAQTRLNQLDDIQKVAEHGLSDGSMTEHPEAAMADQPDPVAPDVVDANPEAVAAAGGRAAAAGEGEDIGGAIGRGFAAAGEAIAEGGGPEDFLGDLAAVGLGITAVIGGLKAQKKPEEPKPLPTIAPTTSKGVIG